MRLSKLWIAFPILLLSFCAFAADNDSLLINDLKKFFFRETGTELKGEFFTKWNESEKPYLYLYVSLPDKVERPEEMKSSFIFCKNDQDLANSEDSSYRAKGYQTFCYKTFAMSAAFLNKRFLSYTDETKSFIVFHELLHNYFSQLHVKIPYEFNEALSDVIGNYGTLKYSNDTHKLNSALVKEQININEKIYQCMNSFINKINNKPQKKIKYYRKCRKFIHSELKHATEFQNDRFNYFVNNAYLLKNMYYCRYYFLLKKVFLKQSTIKDFLDIIKQLPDNTEDGVKFLEKYS
jgi:hypothetical protein